MRLLNDYCSGITQIEMLKDCNKKCCYDYNTYLTYSKSCTVLKCCFCLIFSLRIINQSQKYFTLSYKKQQAVRVKKLK